MTDLNEKINNILAKWDPIEVGPSIAESEYTAYIPVIIDAVINKKKLRNCIEVILTDYLGLDHDKDNLEHVNDLNKVCDDIRNVYEEYRKSMKD